MDDGSLGPMVSLPISHMGDQGFLSRGIYLTTGPRMVPKNLKKNKKKN